MIEKLWSVPDVNPNKMFGGGGPYPSINLSGRGTPAMPLPDELFDALRWRRDQRQLNAPLPLQSPIPEVVPKRKPTPEKNKPKACKTN